MKNVLNETHKGAYVCVLISCDGNKLVLWEGEGLSSGLVAHVLHAIFCHLHNVQPWLVFMKRLQDYHLKNRKWSISTKLHKSKSTQSHACPF